MSQQECITPNTPDHDGMLERVIWTLKGQCGHRVESLKHASRASGDGNETATGDRLMGSPLSRCYSLCVSSLKSNCRDYL